MGFTKEMGTGTKANPAKGPVKFGSPKSDSSNIVKGKSSKTMGVKRNGSDKKQGSR